MKLKIGERNIKISKEFILLIYLFIVIISKVVRYTIMKTVLVDYSRGHGMLEQILNNENLKFEFSDKNSSMAFNNAEVIFKSLNIFEFSTYIQFEVYITIIWNIIIIWLLSKINNLEDNLQGIYLILTIAIMNIFNFNLSKEPIQMLYFLLMYIVLASRKNNKAKFSLSIMCVLFSALTFRNYYILMVMFTIMISFLCNVMILKKEKVKSKDIIFILIMIALTYFIFLNFAKVIYPSSYTSLLKYRLKSHDATSEIHMLLPGSKTNLVIFVIDYLLVAIRLMIPVELCIMGPKYWIFVVYQILVTYFMLSKLKNIKHITSVERYALYLYIGFILTSATFEPDFGSWVRHEAVAFPLFFVMLNLRKVDEKDKSVYINK